MVAGAFTGNISPEATTPFGNIFGDATRGDSKVIRPIQPGGACTEM